MVLTALALTLAGLNSLHADTNPYFSIIEPVDLTGVEGELASVVIIINSSDVTSLDIVRNGRSVFSEEAREFNENEFKNNFSVKSLLKDIAQEELNLDLKPAEDAEDTIERLNEILRKPNFYSTFLIKKKFIKLSEQGKILVKESESFRHKQFASLTDEQQRAILKLNRIILEENFPASCPRSQHSLPNVKGAKYFSKTVKLDNGPNDIVVIGLKDSTTVATQKITVFYRLDISKNFNALPSQYKKKVFHTDESEKRCVACHRLKVKESDNIPQNIKDSVCYPCHKKINVYSNVHGPSARWECLTCHEKDSRPSKYLTKKPDKDLCFMCHTDRKEAWEKKKYVHGPTATGKCTICHNPHATNHEFWLKKAPWELCTTCHEDRASGTHVLTGFGSGGGHPMKDKPDLLRPGADFSCKSCHTPHAANSRSLFSQDVQTMFQLCQVCHKK